MCSRGDFPGTPKIAEMLATGGAGGCIPVFVLRLPKSADAAVLRSAAIEREMRTRTTGPESSPSSAAGLAFARARTSLAQQTRALEAGLATAVRASLPFSRWLDYCSVSILVSERRARANATSLLDALESVDVRELRQRLRRLRHAFGFWANSTVAQPSATDFLYAELCEHARRFRAAGKSFEGMPPHDVAAGDGGLRRCLLS